VAAAPELLVGGFDWRAPNYSLIYRSRAERLLRLRARPGALPALKAYYRENPAAFINEWGVTSDPRNALLVPPRPVILPFILFPKQVEAVNWILERARAREPGLIEKSRDCGISWLAMSLAVTLCLFRPNTTIGFGSAKEDKLDRSGDPDCLFWKGRTFLEHLPPEFLGGWDVRRDSAHLRLIFRETGSAIVGEAGDNIGRGGRSSIFLVDESAHLERPQLIEASLSSNTDCRIDISSVAGMANPFAVKRHGGRIKVFTFHWRDDPRKGEAWYAHQVETLDPVTLAAEVDIDYRASAQGSLIPPAWIHAAVGAAEKLGIKPTGSRGGALDVADEGIDLNAFAGRRGVVLEALRSWSGKNRDIFDTVVQAFALCDAHGYTSLAYDSDGLGSGCRGDARICNEQRASASKPYIQDDPYRGSAAVEDPTGEMIPGRTNADFFANLKAQSWWALRMRFQATHRAIAEGRAADPDAIISLAPHLAELAQLLQELSQPTYSINAAGKVVIDKTPPGCRSPNLADAVCIAFSPATISNRLHVWAVLGAAP
jgi:phage terminase large subunit